MGPQQLLRWIACVTAVSLSGCSLPSWDDLTSREMGVKALWTAAPPPLTVIEKSTDGYARAKAFNKLDEPRDQELLEKHLRLLQAAATVDRDPLCRIAALRTLGRYKDPRAGRILMDVYLGNPGMSAENNAFIRQQALTSLQYQSPSEARKMFIQAARQPGGSLTGAAQRDRMEILDERLTAIRALGKYPEPDAVETLIKLLETEKDIAIRKCAHESLKQSQKKDVPEDARAWREYIATGKVPQRNTSLLAGMLPSDSGSDSGPGVLDTLTNWMRPAEKSTDANATPAVPAPTPSPAPPRPAPEPPTKLPASIPATPLSRANPPTPTSTPGVPTTGVPTTGVPTAGVPAASNRTSGPGEVLPAGAYRNAQGEVVVPVNPPR